MKINCFNNEKYVFTDEHLTNLDLKVTKNSQYDMFFPKLKRSLAKIVNLCFSVYCLRLRKEVSWDYSGSIVILFRMCFRFFFPITEITYHYRRTLLPDDRLVVRVRLLFIFNRPFPECHTVRYAYVCAYMYIALHVHLELDLTSSLAIRKETKVVVTSLSGTTP